jgi:histidinol dehydrogenase
VYSRRSRGLSIGINLFPDKKRCSFDCPYCEVFPFSSEAEFSSELMENDLRDVIASCLEQDVQVRDICFSGNGEPTMSEDFPEALERAGRVRRDLVNTAELVLITNGSFLLDERLFSLLRDAAGYPFGLNIWLKLDAGTPLWYQKINRSGIPFEEITGKVREFAACAPFVIQTMLCAVDGENPPPEEAEAWEKLALELVSIARAQEAGGIRKIQIYGKARPSPEDPKTQALPSELLEARALSLRSALTAAYTGAKITLPPVEVYQ